MKLRIREAELVFRSNRGRAQLKVGQSDKFEAANWR
jgi:hypothetical protein